MHRAPLQVGVLLLGGLGCLVPRSVSAQTTPTYTRYVLGEFVTEPVEKMQADEEWSKQGHMPWRAEPALVASVEARNLMPRVGVDEEPVVEETRKGAWLATTMRDSTTEVTFEVVEEGEDLVSVAVSVNGVRAATIQLERPFGYWWYIGSIATAKGVVARPAAPGEIGWVSLRDALTPHGFGVYWSARDRRAVAVKGRTYVEVAVGDPAVRVGGRVVRVERAPRLIGGRMLVPGYLIADLLSQEGAR